MPSRRFRGTTVLFDPGNFSHGFEGITGLSAILITHQHPDHADPDRLAGTRRSQPRRRAVRRPTDGLPVGGAWQTIGAGDEVTVDHLTVRGVGGRHAVIHPEIPVIDNTSYLIGDSEHPARLMHRAIRCSFPTRPSMSQPHLPPRRG